MSGGEGIQVLHVDDEPAFTDLAADMLEREDDRFTVETATSASDGLERLSDTEYDCIISDYDMPGTDGIEFLERVRDTHSDLPFILYTGKGSEEVASTAISAGVTDYLQKQSGTEQYELLANRVRNAVKQVRARTQADKHRRVSTVVREIDRALVQATSREEIDQRVCQILVDADPYVFAWIGTGDSQTHRVEPQAAAGIDNGYLDESTITTDDSPTGRGPGGTALRENRVVIAQNIRDDDTFHPWRDQALDRGYRAVAAIPLTHKETQYGLLAVYADCSDAFDQAERELLAELGNTIAHAYHRVTIQHEYQDQYRDLFEEAPVMFTFTREVDGEPIIEDCNRLFAERLGYSRDELRGTRLADVYTDESAEALVAGGGYDRALSGEFVREQRDFVTRDGEVVETLLRATPRRTTDGEVIGTHALFVDITDQTRLQTLEELRERMEFALEATDSVLFELDLDSRDETRHGPFERLYGIPPDQLETADDFFEQCVHPDDRDTLRELEQPEAIADRDGSLTHDFRTHPDSGEHRWIQFEAYAVTDHDGTPQRLIGLDTDITERKQRERELERYETIVEASGDPVVVLDADAQITFVNDALVELTGYDREHLIGNDPSVFADPEDIEQAEQVIRSLLSSGAERDTYEVTVTTADGERVACENHIALLPFEEDFQGTVGVVRDISGRKRRAEKLTRLRNYTQELMYTETRSETATIALRAVDEILGFDLGAVFTRSNTQEGVLELLEVLNRPRMEKMYGGLPAFVQDGPAGTHSALAWDVLESGEPVFINDTTDSEQLGRKSPFGSLMMYPMGSHGIVLLAATRMEAFTDTEELLLDVLTTALETAFDRLEREHELRHQRDALERQNERLNKFASVVSHDLRNPLNVATTRLELASEECDSDHLDDVAVALDRMGALIDDLRALAREGEPVGDLEPVGLADVGEACWGTVATESASLVVETDVTVRADRSRLKQLFENLIRNAVEHGGTDVTVTIGDITDGFYVADDGPGLPDEDQNDIFDAGYTTTEDGTGFGLAIVKEIVEAHGWGISVSDSADGGTRFDITGVEFVAE